VAALNKRGMGQLLDTKLEQNTRSLKDDLKDELAGSGSL